MIKTIILCHPQSKNYMYRTGPDSVKISCGTTVMDGVDFSEANDFYPTYAALNSALFETSVIMTVWEHAANFLNGDRVAFLHSDIEINPAYDVWDRLSTINAPAGLTVNVKSHDEFIISDTSMFRYKNDPMIKQVFDANVFVWDLIKKYDKDIYEFANDTNPVMIYNHQFMCKVCDFDVLGSKLIKVVDKMSLSDVGLWTPHVFERLIALYLAVIDTPVLTTAFFHHCSSSVTGPGELNLYGPRGRRFLNINKRCKK